MQSNIIKIFVHQRVFFLVLFIILSLNFDKKWVKAQNSRTHTRQGTIGGGAFAEPLNFPNIRLPKQGVIVGREVSLTRTQKVIQYLGIPYAQPPVEHLRFAPPTTDPLPSWSGFRNASNFGPSCPQITNRRKLHEKLYLRLLHDDLSDPGLSEDCLFLNIYVPDGTPPPERWPVFVWFHSGDFNTGTPAIWDASVFVTKQKVLVVTVAYRLNILGFFTTTDTESSGNFGMLDQIAALDWIHENIELFNGSPKNICIYGHSAGAVSVGLHMMSPLSRGKFAKAIAMSGDAMNSVKRSQDELSIVDQVANKFGCYRKTSDLMECLRNVDVDILIRESAYIETWGPVVDVETNNSTNGPFLPKHPKDIHQDEFFSVPLIAGFTNNEQALVYIESIGSEYVDGRLPINQFEAMIHEESNAAMILPNENGTCEPRPELITEAILFFYRPHPPTKDQKIYRDRYLDLQTDKNYAAGLTQLATKVSSHPTKTQAFVYRFDYRSRTPMAISDVPEWAGVPHMFELPFVWGLPYSSGSKTQWNAADKKMTDIIMSLFATFARNDNPSITTVKWEPYQESNPGILIIERNIDMSTIEAVDYQALSFWNDYYPIILNAATNSCCNITSSVGKLEILFGSSFSITLTVIQHFIGQHLV